MLKVNADSDSDDSIDDVEQRSTLEKTKKISNKAATFSITNTCSTLPIQFTSCVCRRYKIWRIYYHNIGYLLIANKKHSLRFPRTHNICILIYLRIFYRNMHIINLQPDYFLISFTGQKDQNWRGCWRFYHINAVVWLNSANGEPDNNHRTAG